MWIYRMKAFIVNGSSSQMLLMPLNRSMCRTRQLDQCSLQHVGRHDFSITRKISIMSKRLESDHLCRVSWHTRTSAKNKTVFQHIVPFNNQKPAGNHCNLLILQFSSEPKKKKNVETNTSMSHIVIVWCVCVRVCALCLQNCDHKKVEDVSVWACFVILNAWILQQSIWPYLNYICVHPRYIYTIR